MDVTAIGVGFGYLVVALAILVVVVGVSALFVLSVRSDHIPDRSPDATPGTRIDRTRQP